MNINNNFSFVNNDVGYKIIKDNDNIDKKLPFDDNVPPRLIRFLRTLYYYKKYNIKPCIPLYMEYQIKYVDWVIIYNYIKLNNVKIFNKPIFSS